MSGSVSGKHAFNQSKGDWAGWLRWVARSGWLTTSNSDHLNSAARHIEELEAECKRLRESNDSLTRTLSTIVALDVATHESEAP